MKTHYQIIRILINKMFRINKIETKEKEQKMILNTERNINNNINDKNKEINSQLQNNINNNNEKKNINSKNIYNAKLAEQAGRYKEMLVFL